MKTFMFCSITAMALALFSGCSTPEKPVARTRRAMGVPHGKIEYKPIKSDGLSLRSFGKSVFRAGRPAVLTFSLANNGYRKVQIPEWFSHESDNIGLFIQNAEAGITEPDENKWVRLTFDFKKPVLHYPITLMPGNQALISKKLDIVESLMIPPGQERRFFVRAELTLESLKLSSAPILVRVTSNIQQ